MAEKKVPHRSSKAPSRIENLPPDRDSCVYLDDSQYQTLNNCCGALQGITDAMRPIDGAEGLAEALHLVSDKMTDIIDEAESQKVTKLCGGGE
jgi:hypothetical protein